MSDPRSSAPATPSDDVPATLVGPDTGTVVTPINFPALLNVLRRNMLWIGFSALLATGLAAIALAWIPPRYSAEAVIVVKKRPPAVPMEGKVAPGAVEVTDSEVGSAMDAITSTPVLEDAAASLKLDQDPDFNPAARTEDGGDVARGVFERLSSALAAVPGAVRNFLSPAAFDDPHLDVLSSMALALDVSVKAGTRSISLKATANDPRKAADLANAVAEAAVRRDLATKVEDTRRTDAWLAASLAELRARVSRGEEEVYQLRANTGRFEGQTATIFSEQLSNISRELLDARTQLSAARAAREEIARLGRTLDGLSGTDEVLSSATIHSLREQESKLSGDLAAAQGHLGPQHPSLISMKSQLADVRDKIAAEIGRISSEVFDRIRRHSFQVTELERAQTQLESRIEGQSASAARLAELQSDTDSDRATYEAFAIFRAKMAGLLTIERPDIEIVSPALPLRKPSWPKRKVVLVATALGVSCLGFFISVLRVSLDQGLRSVEQIGALLGLPTAALIPRVPGRLGPAEAALAAPSSALAESIRYLFTAVDAARGGQTGFKVLISSALPQEGKSSTALMLARQAALVGIRTLLVRLDLRRPPRPASADADYAVDVADDADSGMSILNVFSRGRETFKALFLRAFWDQLQDACRGYDLVVIDSPPVLSVSDAKIIARFSDMTIFLVKWGSTKAALAGEALRQLRLAHGNAHCVVLTQVNPRLYATYGYGNSGRSGGAHRVSLRTMIAGAAVVVMALVGTVVAWTLLRSGMDALVEAVPAADASGPSSPTMAVARAPEPYSEPVLASAPAPTSPSAAATRKAETAGPTLAQPTRGPTEAVVIPLPAEATAPDRLVEKAMGDEQPAPATPSPLASHAETALLLARGDELLANSDVRRARLFFERAAAQGNTQAMTAMASTYDPLMLMSRNVRGVHPEPRQAISWYRRAAAAGDATAKGRLCALIDVLRLSEQIDASESAALLRVGEEGP